MGIQESYDQFAITNRYIANKLASDVTSDATVLVRRCGNSPDALARHYFIYHRQCLLHRRINRLALRLQLKDNGPATKGVATDEQQQNEAKGTDTHKSANDPSSATRPTGGVDCNRDVLAGLDAMMG